MALTNDGSQHAIHETAGARLSRRSRQVYGIVDGGGGRYAIEVEDLIEAEAEDRDHLGIELAETTSGEMLDQVVKAALPSQRAGHNFRRERPVAIV